MLDEEHQIPPYNTRFDENTYVCGSISGHTVVLATCPQGETGNINAGRLTGPMFKTFPNIRMALLVGIGSGVPNAAISDDPIENIHLGDVIVGKLSEAGQPACVYYDRNRSNADSRFEVVGTIQNPDWRLTSALSILASDYELGRTTFEAQLGRLQAHRSKKRFAQPGHEHDKLFRAQHWHTGNYDPSCHGCDQSQLVERPRRNSQELVFHQGRIATTNAVIEHGEVRDQISERCGGVKCIETEAAGVDANRRCLIIRGVSDYADFHKGDIWRSYAAGNAAAFTRELLCRIQPEIIKDMEGVSEGVSGKLSRNVPEEAPWLVPLPRPQSFVGRESQLGQLRENIFSGDRRFAIYGLGGCGKTALALELLYHTRAQEPSCPIFWVPAISSDSFERAYREIGAILRIPGIMDDKVDVKKLVKAELSNEQFGQWLIVIDNADDANTLFEQANGVRLIDFLPRSRKGSIVFTTRTRVTAVKLAESNVIALGKLTKSEALGLLKTRLAEEQRCQLKEHSCQLQDHQCYRQKDEIVHEFLQMLTCLALTIVQAAAFINANGITLSDYIDHYRQSEADAFDLLSEEFEDRGRYRETRNPIATTWYISFEQIQKQNDLAVDYLSFMACTGNNDIPVSILPATSSKLAHTKAIGMLKAYTFLSERQARDGFLTGNQDKIFDVHPLVHVAMRGFLKAKNQWDECVKKALKRLLNILPYGDHSTKEVWAAYLPHAVHIVGLPEVSKLGEDRKSLLRRIAECETALGRYHAAERTCQEVLNQDVDALGREHLKTLESMSKVGQARFNLGKFAEAEKMHREVLELREQHLGKNHPDTLSSMHELGCSMHRQGKHTQAEKILRETLEIRESVLGKDNRSILSTTSALARSLSHQGKNAEAEKMHREVLAIEEQVLGKKHPNTLISTANIAFELHRQRKYKEAEQIHNEVLELAKEVFGDYHPETISSMWGIAEALIRQHKYVEAESILREELVLVQHTLGKEHPNTLASMGSLASALANQEKDAEAEKLYREVLVVSEKILGENHPDTLCTVQNLGSLLFRQQEYEEGIQFLERGCLGYLNALGEEHRYTLGSMSTLANSLCDHGRYSETEKKYREVLEIRERVFGEHHRKTVRSRHYLAFALYRQKKYEEALEFYKRAYLACKASPESNDRILQEILEDLNYVEQRLSERVSADKRLSTEARTFSVDAETLVPLVDDSTLGDDE